MTRLTSSGISSLVVSTIFAAVVVYTTSLMPTCEAGVMYDSFRIGNEYEHPDAVKNSDLKVIGAGFGRTGTMSTLKALTKLGFGPVYHMTEVRIVVG